MNAGEPPIPPAQKMQRQGRRYLCGNTIAQVHRKVVGIDLGLTDFAVTSNGSKYQHTTRSSWIASSRPIPEKDPVMTAQYPYLVNNLCCCRSNILQ